MDKVVNIAVGSYEGGLLVYKVDIENNMHLRSFATKDAVVVYGLFRDRSRPYSTTAKPCTLAAVMNL